MYLKRLIELDLIQENEMQVSILSSFPQDVSRKLVNEVTSMLLQNRRDSIRLNSVEHIEWVLQVIGYGFSLDLQYANIIESCIMIYSQWILEAHSRPVYFTDNTPLSSGSKIAINQDNLKEDKKAYEQRFLQKCFLQLTQIFEFKDPSENNIETVLKSSLPSNTTTEQVQNFNTGLMQRFIDLCKHVSALFASICRTIGHLLTEETWHILLKCILAITDQILRLTTMNSPFQPYISLENQQNEFQIQNKKNLISDVLCDSILRTLFELWLRSGIHDNFLWDRFEMCFNQWSLRSNVIQHWIIINQALASRMVNILYSKGANLGNELLILNQFGYNINLNLNKDTIYFLFYKMMYLIEHNNNINNKSLDHIVKGIDKIFDILNDIQPINLNGNNLIQSNISGNSILRLLGKWIFLDIQDKNQDSLFYSYSILCKLFSSRSITTFSKEYKNQFLNRIKQGLNHDIAIQSIFIHSNKLFNSPTAAILLLPYYLKSIKFIVPTLSPGFKLVEPIDKIRKGILQLIQPALIIPYEYANYELPDDFDLVLNLPTIFDCILPKEYKNQFYILKYYLIQLLYQFILSETDVYNFKLTLNHFLLLISNDINNHTNLINIFINICINNIIKINLGEDMVIACFDSLQSILLQLEINQDNFIHVKCLLIRLCDYIEELLLEDNLVLSYKSILSALELLCKYILEITNFHLNMIKEEGELLIKLFNIINYGLNLYDDNNYKQEYDNDYNSIKEKVYNLSYQLFYYLFNMYVPNSNNNDNNKEYYYLKPNTLLQFEYNNEDSNNNLISLLIINQYNQLYFNLEPVKALGLNSNVPTSPLFNKPINMKSPNVPIPTPNLELNRISTLSINDTDEDQTNIDSKFKYLQLKQLVYNQIHLEQSYIPKAHTKQVNNKNSNNMEITLPSSNIKPLLIRQLLIQLGLINLGYPNSILNVHYDKGIELINHLNLFNKVYLKCTMLYHCDNSNPNLKDLCLPNIDALSSKFIELVDAFKNKDDNNTIKYQDTTLEMVIECPYLENSQLDKLIKHMQNENKDIQSELIMGYHKYIQLNQVIIIYSEKDINSNNIKKNLELNEDTLVFCVMNANNNLLEVKVISNDDIGPLYNHHKIYKNQFVNLILATIKNKYEQNGLLELIGNRKHILQEVENNLSSNVKDMSSYFSTLF